MKNEWTCFAGTMISASESPSGDPISPLARDAAERAQRIRSASNLPLGTWVRLCITSIRLVANNDKGGSSTVTKWEYASVPLISHALQEILNQWGEEGWELVQVQESQSTGTVAFLKRPKQEGSSS